MPMKKNQHDHKKDSGHGKGGAASKILLREDFDRKSGLRGQGSASLKYPGKTPEEIYAAASEAMRNPGYIEAKQQEWNDAMTIRAYALEPETYKAIKAAILPKSPHN